VFGVEHGLPVVLPSAQKSPRLAVQQSEVFRLEVRADGSVLAERRSVRVEQIGPLLVERQRQRQAQGKAELVVILETHPDAAYELWVAVLDQVRFAGCRRVALATTPGK
jgi:biopolymer transport protein ExbD